MIYRREKVRNLLKEKNLDGILVKSKGNKGYLGALLGSGVKVLITQREAYQIMDGRYINEAETTTTGFSHICHNQGENYLNIIFDLLGENGNLGVEAGETLAEEYLQMKQYSFNITLLQSELEYIRRIKTQPEIEKIKGACKITDEVFEETIKEIKVGMKEYEISALIHYLSLKKGGTGMAFDTIVASGPRGAMPHGRPTDRKVAKGDFITLDFGVVYQGYQSDMTRTVSLGPPQGKMKEIYDLVLQAQRAGVDFIKSGVTGKEVDEHVRKIIEKRGYGEYFNHGLGHGIGIGGGGELPLLNQRSEMMLEEGMVMSCEPGIYIPNLGGVRIEDDVLIEDGVGVPLNHTTKELIILEG